jgi:predicted transcriptional regulator
MKQLTANVLVETQQKGANHGFVITSDGIVLIEGKKVSGKAPG